MRHSSCSKRQMFPQHAAGFHLHHQRSEGRRETQWPPRSAPSGSQYSWRRMCWWVYAAPPCLTSYLLSTCRTASKRQARSQRVLHRHPYVTLTPVAMAETSHPTLTRAAILTCVACRVAGLAGRYRTNDRHIPCRVEPRASWEIGQTALAIRRDVPGCTR